MKTSAGIEALWDQAVSLHEQSRYGDALDCLHSLEKRLPNHPVLLANLGVVYRDNGDLVSAERYLLRACAVRPNDAAAHFNLALTLLRAGRLGEGFREYEWRWRVKQFREQRRQFPQPLWRGEPLDGRRILIHGEQGAGDTIQFVRYAPMLRKTAGEVIIEVLPHLERLLSWMDGAYRIVSALSTGVECDVQCPLMSLPQRFGTEQDTIPAPASFSIPAATKAKWAARVPKEQMNAGVVWAGNPKRYKDEVRSLPAHQLLPLTHVPGVQWWSLQAGPAAEQTPGGMVNLAEELTDFGETAAVISALDLVITVDTAVAHLAGSLRKPVWLLLPYTSDWRWMLAREDTPWYSSVRLFRQKRPGEWGELVETVASRLEAWIQAR